jgi:outer membrane protein OmpA-like peptidoglycan-associated protein
MALDLNKGNGSKLNLSKKDKITNELPKQNNNSNINIAKPNKLNLNKDNVNKENIIVNDLNKSTVNKKKKNPLFWVLLLIVFIIIALLMFKNCKKDDQVTILDAENTVIVSDSLDAKQEQKEPEVEATRSDDTSEKEKNIDDEKSSQKVSTDTFNGHPTTSSQTKTSTNIPKKEDNRELKTSETPVKNSVNLFKKENKLYFTFGKVNLDIEKSEIGEIVKFLNQKNVKEITIEGNTCDIGDNDVNLEISKKRAENVKQLLISNGLTSNIKINIVANGEEKIVSKDKTLNRSVQIIFN